MAKAPLIVELGSSGLKKSGSILAEEFDNALKGNKKYKVYQEMSQGDAVIGAILFAIKNIAKTSKWTFKPASNSKKDKKIAKLLNDNIKNLDSQTWEEHISEFLSMLTYGFSYHEICYRKEKGWVAWSKFPIRAQTTLWEWDFAPNGDVRAFIQNDPYSSKLARIPVEKALLLRPDTHKNNPEGMSILRTAFRAWNIKKHIESIEAVGIERNLAGIPIAYIPAEIIAAAQQGDVSATAMYNSFKDIVTNLRNDEQAGMVIPQQFDSEFGHEMYKIDLLTGNFQKAIETNQIIERYDQRIAASVLADLIFLGSGASSGSWAIGSMKEGMLKQAINNYLDVIASAFNSYAIPRLMQLNGIKKESYPILEHSSLQGVDLNSISRFVERLSRANIPFTEEEGASLKALVGVGQDMSSGTESLYESAGGSKDKLA